MPVGETGARTVRMWLVRGRIPVEWFSDIAKLAVAKGHPEINETSMAAMARQWRLARPPSKRRKAA